MAEAVENSANENESAERAYAAAADSAVAKADEAASPAVRPELKQEPAPLDFPAKPVRARTSAAAPQPATAAPQPVEAVAAVVPAPVAVARTTSAPVPAPAAKKVSSPKKPVAAQIIKPAKVKKVAAETKPAKKVATTASKPPAPVKAKKAAKPVFKPSVKFSPILAIKETIMANKQTTDFTKTIKTAAADVQVKAKLALAKGSAVIADASDFTKGNVDAVVASGKILAAGMQDLGKGYVAEGKSAYETLTADVKELTAVKSPADFIRVQTAIVRRNLDTAFGLGAKNSEAVLKLAGDSFAPISARVSLAVDKFKKAA